MTRPPFSGDDRQPPTAISAMPQVRGAYAGRQADDGFWDMCARRQQKHRRRGQRVGGEREGQRSDRLHITSSREYKNLDLPIAAEAGAVGTRHRALRPGKPQAHAKESRAVDEILGELIKQNGPVNPDGRVSRARQRPLGRACGTVAARSRAPCSRIDLRSSTPGIDVSRCIPRAREKAEAGDPGHRIKAAEACAT